MPEFKPYVSHDRNIPELGVLPILLGCVLGIVFGGASLYLALKVGMTISASIPVAVLSISIFKWFSKAFGMRPATILENNIVQTVGSAGESIAFGVACTIPALLILGHDIDLWRTTVVAVLGGLLGILMMIPLRKGMIVKGHGELAYPEGTACAEVLIAGEKGGTNAKTVFTGFGVGFLYKFLAGEGGTNAIKNTVSKMFSQFKGVFQMEVSPEFLGVGYIIGPRIAWITFGGGVLAYLVLIPCIYLFGDALTSPIFPATKLIKDMSPGEIRNNYVLYIAAGAVTAAGIVSMIRVMPAIYHAFIAGFKDLTGNKTSEANIKRTDKDLSMGIVVVGSLVLVGLFLMVPSMHLSLMGALLLLFFGFLFVTVSSRLTGEVGSSSNPISGMTIATLLFTCLLFVALGKTSPTERVAALMIAAIVCVASANGGTTSQDLKTGFLVGATPKYQQIGILFGSMASALVLGYMLQLFNNSATIYEKIEVPGFRVSKELLGNKQTLSGPEARADAGTYNAVFFTGETAPKNESGLYIVEPGKYLVDDAGTLQYLVDPGINGKLSERKVPGSEPQKITKFDAPKARLMSLIIDGILTQKLPWGLVILGFFITLVMELAGVPSLAFATGVYLPIAITSPLAVGGLIRYLVDRKSQKKTHGDGDTAPGVLFSSGLIAGGAIAGTIIALMMGLSEKVLKAMDLSKVLGAFATSDGVAVGSMVLLSCVVYLVGREKILKN